VNARQPHDPPFSNVVRGQRALAESFFGSIKGELLDVQSWPAHAGARRAVTEYVGWYNGTRLLSSLGYLSHAISPVRQSGQPHPVRVAAAVPAPGRFYPSTAAFAGNRRTRSRHYDGKAARLCWRAASCDRTK